MGTSQHQKSFTLKTRYENQTKDRLHAILASHYFTHCDFRILKTVKMKKLLGLFQTFTFICMVLLMKYRYEASRFIKTKNKYL